MLGVRATHSLAVALVAAAGCYMDPINERPSAEIRRDGEGLVFRNQELQLQAIVDEPDGDRYSLAWRATACNGVAGEPGVVCGVAGTGVDPEFRFTVPSRVEGRPTQHVHVDLDVTDARGARARPRQGLSFAVSNRPPMPDLRRTGRELDGQFPVSAPITISALGRDEDGDVVTLAWQLFAASASRPEDVVFERLPDPPSGGEAYRLVPDVAGEWTVRVTADDGTESRTEDLMLLVRPDHAPCLGAISPPADGVVLAFEPRRFAVLIVDDDLDVYPPPPPDDAVLGAARFTWSMRPAGAGAFAPIATGVAAVDFDPARFTPGDRIELRVDVADRRDDRPNNCAPDAPTCSIEPPASCQQRRTWTVEAR